ncbi:ADP-ribosylglycohydrolase family protein [Pelomyxa schiedti]|nr:ADP-ribosylglycohydrolase family protein [Pelomyxa schiedti]
MSGCCPSSPRSGEEINSDDDDEENEDVTTHHPLAMPSISSDSASCAASSPPSSHQRDCLLPRLTRPTSLEPELQRRVFAYTTDGANRCVASPIVDDIVGKRRCKDNLGSMGSLCYVRVLAEDDPDRATLLRKLAGEEPWASPAEARAVGVLLGMAIGDSFGARLEFSHIRYGVITLRDMNNAGGSFGLRSGQWTDDNSMGLCVADSLLSSHGTLDPHDLMIRFQAWWNGGYNNGFCYDSSNHWKHSVGLGGNISMSMHSYLRQGNPYTTAGDRETSGNGSIMRNGAPPVCHHDNIALAEETARLQSLVTHQGDEAAECCRLLAHVVVKAINGESKESIMTNLGTTFHSEVPSARALARSETENGDPNRNWQWRADEYRYSPKRANMQPGYIGSYAMDGLCMALHCIWTTNSFEEAIIKSANLCGDADSVTSVTGQMAGALYGANTIPQDWMNKVMQWDGHGDIPLRAYRLFHHKYL